MSNDNSPGEDPRNAALEAILLRAAKDGFTPAVLREEGAYRWFPDGLGDLMAFWTHRDDVELEARLTQMNLMELPVRQRIRAGILTRFAIIRPHKEAARKGMAAIALPHFVGQGAKVMWSWADVVWRAAGDTSTDINYYSKRGILAGVASAALIAWYGDDSEDEHQSTAFLDARIANVMAFEKFKASAKSACTGKSA